MIETRKINVYRVTVMIVDHDETGESGIKTVLENANYPNDCISPYVMEVESREVDWHDGHPLNLRSGMRDEFKRLFGED